MPDWLGDFLGPNWLAGLIGLAALAVIEEVVRRFVPKPRSKEQLFAEHRRAIADAGQTAERGIGHD